VGKGGRCVGLTTSPAPFPDCVEMWKSELRGIPWVCISLNRYCFKFINTGESLRDKSYCRHHEIFVQLANITEIFW